MANYCTNEDIQVLLQMNSSFSASTTPTSTQVETEIDNITKEIDVYLRAIGITSQPIDTNVLGMLKKYCGYGVACRVGMSFQRNEEGVRGTQAEFYCQKYQEFLDKILEHPEIITDTVDASDLFISNQVQDGTITENDLNKKYIVEDFKV